MKVVDLQEEIITQTITKCDEFTWFLTGSHRAYIKGSELHRKDTPRMMRELARFLEVQATRYTGTLA